MKQNYRRWLVMLALVGGCLGLPACGGGDGGDTVTGDSPEGIDPDRVEEAEGLGPDTEPGEVGPDDSLTDGE